VCVAKQVEEEEEEKEVEEREVRAVGHHTCSPHITSHRWGVISDR
jgi:hypothetical protein